MAMARRSIKIEDAFEDALRYCKEILKRNEILIGYWIYPHKTPTQIAEYEPVIKKLQSRIKNLQKLDYSQLKCVINDPDCLAASYLQEHVQSLDDAVYGFKKLFVEHYNSDLGKRSPYDTIPQSLANLKLDLQDLQKDRRADRSSPMAEDEVRTGPLRFCKGAVQLINGNDYGKLGVVSEKDLLKSNRDILRAHKGCYLWWQCSTCKFQVRYHAMSSRAGTIETNDDELREHARVPLEYRTIWMAKSHLHQASESGKGAKYGCLFCYGEGKKLSERTTFATGKELATHICSRHKTELPPPLMLNKFKMAVDEKKPESGRWELKLHTR